MRRAALRFAWGEKGVCPRAPLPGGPRGPPKGGAPPFGGKGGSSGGGPGETPPRGRGGSHLFPGPPPPGGPRGPRPGGQAHPPAPRVLQGPFRGPQKPFFPGAGGPFNLPRRGSNGPGKSKNPGGRAFLRAPLPFFLAGGLAPKPVINSDEGAFALFHLPASPLSAPSGAERGPRGKNPPVGPGPPLLGGPGASQLPFPPAGASRR